MIQNYNTSKTTILQNYKEIIKQKTNVTNVR